MSVATLLEEVSLAMHVEIFKAACHSQSPLLLHVCRLRCQLSCAVLATYRLLLPHTNTRLFSPWNYKLTEPSLV